MIRTALALLLLAALQPPTHARPTPSTVDTPHLAVTVASPPRAVASGARVSLRLDITPKAKMHVYAPEQADYIPISLTVARSDDYVAHAAVFPKPETLYFKPLEETQLVYSKPFRIVQDVTVARTAARGGTITVSGTLRYQACDDSLCYPPRNVPVTWTVPIR
jgi:DsbC/DsbD-like thiol-disulfide interchange protein